jgi:hypothetical protein
MYRTKTWSGGGGPNTSNGFRIRVMGPWFFYGMTFRRNFEGFEEEEFPNLLNEFSPNLRARVTNALLLQFLTEVEDGDANTDGNLYNEGLNKLYNKSDGSIYWERYTGSNDASNKLEPKDILESEIRKGDDIFDSNVVGMWVDQFYYLIPKFYDLGLDDAILERLINWCAAAWPLINWDALRKNLSTPELTSDKGIYLSYSNNYEAVTIHGLTNGVYNFVVYDLHGRTNYNRRLTITGNSKIIDTQRMQLGIYVLSLRDSKGNTKAFKFFKK